MVEIIISNGDIFASKAHILVNPVNCLGVMGAGLAAQFKHNFPEMYKYYRLSCGNGGFRIGRLNIYQYLIEESYPWFLKSKNIDDYTTGYIVNMPTKDHWKDPSRIEYIEIGMNLLVDFINRTNSIKSVAIPALGSGLGGLDWKIVEKTINFYLNSIEREVTAYVYPPK